jgi:hypothetical protein
MDLLHATIEEFAAEGYTHIACHCPRCRMIRLGPISWLPHISMGLTIAQLSVRLRCAECGPGHSAFGASLGLLNSNTLHSSQEKRANEELGSL